MMFSGSLALLGLIACAWHKRTQIQQNYPRYSSPGQWAFSADDVDSHMNKVIGTSIMIDSPLNAIGKQQNTQHFIIDSWMNIAAPIIFTIFILLNWMAYVLGGSTEMMLMTLAQVFAGGTFLMGVWIAAMMDRVVEHYCFYIALTLLAASI